MRRDSAEAGLVRPRVTSSERHWVRWALVLPALYLAEWGAISLGGRLGLPSLPSAVFTGLVGALGGIACAPRLRVKVALAILLLNGLLRAAPLDALSTFRDIWPFLPHAISRTFGWAIVVGSAAALPVVALLVRLTARQVARVRWGALLPAAAIGKVGVHAMLGTWRYDAAQISPATPVVVEAVVAGIAWSVCGVAVAPSRQRMVAAGLVAGLLLWSLSPAALWGVAIPFGTPVPDVILRSGQLVGAVLVAVICSQVRFARGLSSTASDTPAQGPSTHLR